jgi:hypothetical protein
MVVGATFGLPSAAPRAVLVALSPLFSPPPRDVIRQNGDYPWTQSPRMHARLAFHFRTAIGWTVHNSYTS